MIVNKNLDLSNSGIESLGSLKEVQGILNLEYCKNLKSFGNLEKIGKLSLYDNIHLRSFEKIKEIDKIVFNFELNTPLYYIPENIKVNTIQGVNLEIIDFNKIPQSLIRKYCETIKSYIAYASSYGFFNDIFVKQNGIHYTVTKTEFFKFDIDFNIITRETLIKFYKKINSFSDWIYTNEIIKLKLNKIIDLRKLTSYESILKYEKNI